MTIGTTVLCLLSDTRASPRNPQQLCACVALKLRPVLSEHVLVLVVREIDLELGGSRLTLRRFIERHARVREGMARTIARGRVRVTDRADDGSRTREELLAMTVGTRRVFGIVGHVLERGRTFAHLVPVRSRKLVASITRLIFMLGDGVREFRVLAARPLSPRRATTPRR